MKTELLVNKETEKEIVKMRKKGISIKEIAEQLSLSEKTVKAVAVSKKCTDKDLIEQRTKKVAKLIAEGYSKKEIMKKLKISEHQYRVSFRKLREEDEQERLEIANKAKERFEERNSVLDSDAAEPEIFVSSEIKSNLDKTNNIIPENNKKPEVKKEITSTISRKEKFKEGLEKFLRMMIIIIRK